MSQVVIAILILLQTTLSAGEDVESEEAAPEDNKPVLNYQFEEDGNMQVTTAAEEDVFDVDLVPLADPSTSMEDSESGSSNSNSDVPISLRQRTENGSIILDPVFSGMNQLMPGRKAQSPSQGPLGDLISKGEEEKVKTSQEKSGPEETTTQEPQKGKLIRRVRRVYRVPPGQSVQYGTFYHKTPDGRSVKIIRRRPASDLNMKFSRPAAPFSQVTGQAPNFPVWSSGPFQYANMQ